VTLLWDEFSLKFFIFFKQLLFEPNKLSITTSWNN